MEEQKLKLQQECVCIAIDKMVNKMREELAKTQNIAYPEQIIVAGIYDLVKNQLAKACIRKYDCSCENCLQQRDVEKPTMDTFILLGQLKEDNIISQEYHDALFDSLVEINPDLKEQVEKDRASGLL